MCSVQGRRGTRVFSASLFARSHCIIQDHLSSLTVAATSLHFHYLRLPCVSFCLPSCIFADIFHLPPFLSVPVHPDFPLLTSRSFPSGPPRALHSTPVLSQPTPIPPLPPPRPVSENSPLSSLGRLSFPHLSVKATPDEPSEPARLSLSAGADTPLMTAAHSPVSLVFLPALLLLLAVSGRRAAEPVEAETGKARVL